MALTASHARLILQIESTLMGEEGEAFAEALLDLVRHRMGTAGAEVMREIKDRVDPLLETQRVIGEVNGILNIATKVERIAKGFMDSGDVELGQAFARFGERLVKFARKKGQPVMDRAESMRTENARRN
jgi:hypothetical protein